jgi:hypothetical protein
MVAGGEGAIYSEGDFKSANNFDLRNFFIHIARGKLVRTRYFADPGRELVKLPKNNFVSSFAAVENQPAFT